MIRLDEQQSLVVNAVVSAAMAGFNGKGLKVSATAGSGKTETLVESVVGLLSEGVPAESIVVTTFTNKGAKTLKERLEKRVGMERARGLQVGTFHSLALRSLRSIEFGQWPMESCVDLPRRRDDLPSTLTIWSSIVTWRRGGIVGLGRDSLQIDLQADYSVFDYMTQADLIRARGLDQGSPEADEAALDSILPSFARAWGLYEEAKAALGAWDFADSLSAFKALLKEGKSPFGDPAFVFVDEAQDNSRVQLDIARLLARKGHLVLIGDPRQAIFSWRGAAPEVFLDETSDFELLSIPTNYRSGSRIVEAGNAIAAGNSWSLGDEARPARKGGGGLIRFWNEPTVWGEAARVAGTIGERLEAGEKADNFAILVRTNSAAGAFEVALMERQIPVLRVGHKSFFESDEALNFVAYAILSEVDSWPALERIYNKPKRYLGKAFLNELSTHVNNGTPLIPAIGLAARAARGRSRGNAQNFAKVLNKLRHAPWPDRAQDIAKLLKPKSKDDNEVDTLRGDDDRSTFVEMCASLSQYFPTGIAFAQYADSCARNAETARGSDAQQQRGRVVLSTVHRCVSPDTLVEGPWGLARIADIPEEGPRIATVLGSRAYRNKVTYEDRAMLRITTRRGYEIEVTEDHGLFTWDPEAGEYVRRGAVDLAEGNFLRLRLERTTPAKGLHPLPPLPVGDARALRPDRMPLRLNKDCAELFGLLVADGTVYQRGFRLVKRHRDVVERFVRLVQLVFGVNAEVKRRKNEDAWYAEVNSTLLATWLLEIGGMGPHDKAVPNVVLSARMPVQSRFLRGLYADGTVNVKGEEDDDGRHLVDHVSLSTIYPDIARIVQTLLLRFGIVSSRFPIKGTTDIRVVAYGQDALRFGYQIGFVSAFKQDRLNDGTFGPETQQNAVPVHRDDWRLPDHDCAVRRNVRRRGYISRHTARTLGDFWQELGFYHARIAKIERFRGPAICVEVPEVGRFLQNGFDGANSKGLEWPSVFVSATYNVFPHQRARNKKQRAEELRLFYVAVTRARDELVITSSERDQFRKEAGPSPFVDLIRHLENG